MFTENMCFANFKEYLQNSKLCQIKMSHQRHHTVFCEVTYKMTNFFFFATKQELRLLFHVLPILNFIESSLDVSIDYRKLKRVTNKNHKAIYTLHPHAALEHECVRTLQWQGTSVAVLLTTCITRLLCFNHNLTNVIHLKRYILMNRSKLKANKYFNSMLDDTADMLDNEIGTVKGVFEMLFHISDHDKRKA